MEAFATGFKRIDAACKDAGVKYEFLKEEYGFTVRFHRHCGEIWEKENSDFQALFEKGLEKGPEKGPENDLATKTNEMMARCESVLGLIKKNPRVSQPTLAKDLNLTVKQVRIALDRLKADKIVHFEGVGKGGQWVIDKEEQDSSESEN